MWRQHCEWGSTHERLYSWLLQHSEGDSLRLGGGRASLETGRGSWFRCLDLVCMNWIRHAEVPCFPTEACSLHVRDPGMMLPLSATAVNVILSLRGCRRTRYNSLSTCEQLESFTRISRWQIYFKRAMAWSPKNLWFTANTSKRSERSKLEYSEGSIIPLQI